MNSLKGEAPLTLGDGREYVLVLGFEAYVAAEAVYGKPFQTVMADAQAGYLGATRALLHGALQIRHAGELSLADVGTILEHDSDAVMTAITTAIDRAYPKSEGKESGKDVPAGTSSGRSGAARGSSRTRSGGKPRARSR